MGTDRAAYCQPCPFGPACAECARDATGGMTCTACVSNFVMSSWGECWCSEGYTKYEFD
jgi:hypothetical protein